MKKQFTILALLLITAIATMAQGSIVLVPSMDYNVTHNASSMGLGVGLTGINESSLVVSVFQKRFFGQDNPNFTSGVLTGTVFPFDNGVGFHARGRLTRGTFLSDLIQGDPILCDCTGKVIGYEDSYRNQSVANKIFGTIGTTFKYNNVRLYGEVNINDYNPEQWFNQKSNPYRDENIELGIEYSLPLKSYK